MSPSEPDATPAGPDQPGAGSVRGLDTHLAHRLADRLRRVRERLP